MKYSNFNSKNFYGRRTPYVDVNGKKLYEYDRVSVCRDSKEFVGTIINSANPYEPENFKIILDRIYWSGTTPMFENFENVRLLNENDPGYRFYSPVMTLKEFCNTYDYHSAQAQA
jgi:hypothetical protein